MNALEALKNVAPQANNEALGVLAAEMIKTGAITPFDVGRAMRPILGNMATTPTQSNKSSSSTGVSAADSKAGELPDSEVARSALLETIYESFGSHKSRSVPALSRLTGLSQDCVLELIKGNQDFRVRVGKESNTKYVSLKGI